MALAAEIVFQNAVATAAATRQASYASAFATYGWVAANYAAYKVAIADADVAYITAVNAAANTADLLLGNHGHTGPIPTVWAAIAAPA
jgi:hypothetical protein